MEWKRAEKSSFCQLHLTEVVPACTIDGSCPKRERERAGAGGARTPAYRTRPPERGPPRRGRQGRARQELDRRRGVGLWPLEARSSGHEDGGRPPDIGARHPRYTVARLREKGRRRAGERRYGKKRKRKRKVHCNHFHILVHVKM